MTKSTITRERLEELAAGRSGFNLRIATHEESQELARMALAAMDGEPVVQPVMFIDGDISTDDADKLAKVIREFNEEDERPLAKMARIIRENPHPTNECDMPKAQPARVVQDERAAFNAWNNEDNLPIAGVGAKNAAWLAWQARAMLQAEPVATANKLGNSPVIGIDPASVPDRTVEVRYVAPPGFVLVPKEPTEEMNKAGWAAMNEHDAINPTYSAMLAAAPAGIPINSATWIPVSERMPGRYYVLAADFSGRHYPPSQPNTQVGIHDDWFGDGKPTWDDGDGNDLHLKQVTHWMPLPAAPQEVK